MSFPRYPKYKDSGVEWLGELPEHWGVTPLKYVARFTSGGTPSKSVADYWNGDVPWASSKDLKSETLSETCDHITRRALDEGAAVLVPAGSVLVVVRGMILLHTFPVVQTLVPMAINQDVKAVAPTNGVAAVYLPWLLRGSATETFGRIDEAAHGTKVLRMESWTSIALPIPPRPEQAAIATFLDRETAKIDTLIAEQQRLIELLQEKRQAVISYTVTKGLNPDAPMKDSEVEWLGEVPEHWEVAPLRRLDCLVQTGPFGSQLHADEYVLGGTPVVNPTHIVGGRIIPSEDITVADEVLVRLPHQRLRKGDVVFSRRGELGRCAVVTTVEDGWLCGTGSMILRLNGDEYISDYLALFLSLDVLRQYFESFSVGTVMDSLSADTLLSLPVVVPPLPDQRDCITHSRSHAQRIDELRHQAATAVALLQERRSAIISAAVTGQIDVRSLAGSEAA